MYTKTSWVARVGTALNRFLKTNETSTEVELTNDPTGVTTAGTPFTVANMNKIEDGIYDAHVGLDNNGLIDNTRINQDVRTTASPTFANATIAGHNIDSELDTLNGRVNQGVKTTDSPTFASIVTTNGPNKPVDNSSAVMPEVGIGGFTYASATYPTANSSAKIWIPNTGIFIVHIEFDAKTTAAVSPSTPVLQFTTKQNGGYSVEITQDAPVGSQLRAWAMRLA